MKLEKVSKVLACFFLQTLRFCKTLKFPNIYKPFTRPHLDYGSAIYDQQSN